MILDEPNIQMQKIEILNKYYREKEECSHQNLSSWKLFAIVSEKINLCLGCICKMFIIYSTINLFYLTMRRPWFEVTC